MPIGASKNADRRPFRCRSLILHPIRFLFRLSCLRCFLIFGSSCTDCTSTVHWHSLLPPFLPLHRQNSLILPGNFLNIQTVSLVIPYKTDATEYGPGSAVCRISPVRFSRTKFRNIHGFTSVVFSSFPHHPAQSSSVPPPRFFYNNLPSRSQLQ